MRWRMASDSSGSRAGWRVDTVDISFPIARRLLHAYSHGHTEIFTDGDSFCETDQITSAPPGSDGASDAIATNTLSRPSSANLRDTRLNQSVKTLTIFSVFG